MNYNSMNIGSGIRLVGNSNYYNVARGIKVSRRTVVELQQGDRVRGVTESGVNSSRGKNLQLNNINCLPYFCFIF